jgi:hypothetical protein
VGLFLIFAHVQNLIIRHSPEDITTAQGGGFLSHTKKYNEVIKDDKEFSEAKRIRIKIKELVQELKELLLKNYS